MVSSEKSPLLKNKEAPHPTLVWSYAELLAPPIVLLFVGIVFLAFTEDWPLLTCGYVITQIITTIGYGDFHAKTTASKMFMAAFAVVMLIFAAYVMAFLSDTLLKTQSEAITKYLRRLESADPVISKSTDAKEAHGDLNKLLVASASCIGFVLFGTVLFRNLEGCTCGMERLEGCLDPDYATCLSTGGYQKNFSDAFFMSVMTLTTIGFGDFQPRSAWGRAVAIPWMFFGVATFANSISTVASVFYERRKSKILVAADGSSSRNQAIFSGIDKDGKGYLDKYEFLAFTLLKYDVVSADLVAAIIKDYEHLEGAKGGHVTHAMIKERQIYQSAVEKGKDKLAV